MAAASLRGLPRGRLSVWAGLPVDVVPTLLQGGEGPWSEGSTDLSSDDILEKMVKKRKIRLWQVLQVDLIFQVKLALINVYRDI